MKGLSKFSKRFCVGVLSLILAITYCGSVKAVTMQDIQNEKAAAEKEKQAAEDSLQTVESDIESISEEKEAIEEELNALDEILIDLLLEVSLMKTDIADKQAAIAQAQIDYEEALEREEKQHDAMMRRIKFMYEKGNESYIEILLESKSMAEAVNRVDYTEKLYSYDRMLLEQFQLAKQDVANTKLQLETDLSELEEMEEDLENQESELNTLIHQKQETVEGFSRQLESARAQASEYEKQIKQQSDNLKRLNEEEQKKIAEELRKKAEAEAKRKAEEAAKKKAEEDAKKSAAEAKNKEKIETKADEKTVTDEIPVVETTDEVTTTDVQETAPTTPSQPVTQATGSGIGTEIANYGLQFVGNPYVSGGTSLTNGCDCSGFTQSVYSHFGISIPRSSYSQSCGGTEVAYGNIQAGDILYYGGHVGIYIGNDQIVHASTQATGIKVSSAFYRSIITIRRYY